MSKRSAFYMFIFLCCVFLTGCVTRLVDFTLISTKNVDLSRGADFKRGQSRVEAEDKVLIILFIPTGTPNIKQAIDKAIQSVPGAIALLDGVVSVKGWWIPYIYGENSYVVEGTPLIDPKLVTAPMPSNFIIGRLDKAGNVKELKYVNKEEYDRVKKRIGA